MTSEISIAVTLGDDKMPAKIEWKAPGAGIDDLNAAKGLLLGLWDGKAKEALRIDLWTTNMMVDEMNDFFYQSLIGMSQTYQRATNNAELAKELKEFADKFYQKSMDALQNNQ